MDGAFLQALLAWYDANKRALPWRQTPEPYGVWISEIMAQQTQMERVVAYWNRWMLRYPDLDALAHASEEDVLKSWEGLGYYSRARNIRKAAARILDEFGGEFPSVFKDIHSLPGIGEYTAGAIASIAFGQARPALDANVFRIFSRLLDIAAPIKDKSAKEAVSKAVKHLIPADRPGDFNQALMEFGALICSKRPACERCPFIQHCAAYENGTVSLRPVLSSKKEIIKVNMVTGVLLHQGKVLIQKRKPDDVWPGLWEFPGGGIEKNETPQEALRREYMEEVELNVRAGEKITVVKYAYTRYRITMHCYRCHLQNGKNVKPVFNEAVEGRFIHPRELNEYAFPAGHRRLITFMQSDVRFSEYFSFL